MKSFCFICHRDMASHVDASRERHQPVEEGRCLICHDAHRSDERKLLRADFPEEYSLEFKSDTYALCWQCHDRNMVLEEKGETVTAFRNGSRNLHRVHVNQKKGRSCKACHGVHAASQNSLMQYIKHHRGGRALPIAYTDTPTGGNCVVGCHREMNYDRENPVSY